jgi:dipeptidyl aminopeptidase/acylaminoacyl peptidase
VVAQRHEDGVRAKHRRRQEHQDLRRERERARAVLRLARTGKFAGAPSWSADGRRILFTGSGAVFGECRRHAFVVGPDGSGFRRLIRSEGSAWEPAWSPDGKRLVRLDEHERAWISLGTGAGTQLRRLTLGAHPAWSPDGGRLAFMRMSGGINRIFVIGADGAAVRRLTKGNDFVLSPAWCRTARGSCTGAPRARSRASTRAASLAARPRASAGRRQGSATKDPAWRASRWHRESRGFRATEIRTAADATWSGGVRV